MASQRKVVSPGRYRGRRDAFTLMEILIVISIIALLSSLVARAIFRAREEANIGATKIELGHLVVALEQYLHDEGTYPGSEVPRDSGENAFPALYRALLGVPRPHGPGGRSAPYFKLQAEDIAVYDRGKGTYRRATRDEREEDEVDKYLLDPFGTPYVYCLRRDLRSGGSRILGEVYSLGPNLENDTVLGTEESDDISGGEARVPAR